MKNQKPCGIRPEKEFNQNKVTFDQVIGNLNGVYQSHQEDADIDLYISILQNIIEIRKIKIDTNQSRMHSHYVCIRDTTMVLDRCCLSIMLSTQVCNVIDTYTTRWNPAIDQYVEHRWKYKPI